LTDEGDITPCPGIQVKKWDNEEKEGLQLSQPHLMRRIIDAAGLTDQQLHDMPAEPRKLLTKESNGEPCKHNCNYQSMVGMLNYLCVMRPKILFVVHQCARFSIDPKLCHEITV